MTIVILLLFNFRAISALIFAMIMIITIVIIIIIIIIINNEYCYLTSGPSLP